MRLKKRVQQLEERVYKLENKDKVKTKIVSVIVKPIRKCRICGKKLPSSRTAYCSKNCSRVADARGKRIKRLLLKENKVNTRPTSISPSFSSFSYLNKELEKVCKICGSKLPENRSSYCSKKCAKKGHSVACLNYIRKKNRVNNKIKKSVGKSKWIPSEREIEMFDNNELTVSQWKEHFGLYSRDSVYRKLGQIAMYKGQIIKNK